MSLQSLPAILPLAAGAALAGALLGFGYFAALRRSVDALCARRGWLAPLGWTLARMAAAVAVFGAAAWFGVVALGAALLGFVVVRGFVLHNARRST
jgi:hypothetical protein